MNCTRRSFIKIGAGLGMSAACATTLFGCGSSAQEQGTQSVQTTLTAVGSTALQPLVEASAKKYQETHKNIQINVQGGGSGQGIAQIAQNTVQIGNSDVFAETKITDKNALEKLQDNKVCVVGMAPIVHPEVSVDNVTLDQLRDVFCGKILNWKELGGKDQEIVVVQRAQGSGTRATFENAVMRGTKAPEAFKPQEQDSSGTVAKVVMQTPGAISYLAFSYLKNTKAKTLKIDGIAAEDSQVANGSWPIWAYEHMYTQKDAQQETKDFIGFILSEDTQKTLVKDNGYIPVVDMQVEMDAHGVITKK